MIAIILGIAISAKATSINPITISTVRIDDIIIALMAIPNMIAIIFLSKVVTKEMRERSWI